MSSAFDSAEIVISGQLFRKTSNKIKGKKGWSKKTYSLTSEGKFFEDKTLLFSLSQRTRTFNSEYRDFCFSISTPNFGKIILATTSQKEKDEWLKILEKEKKKSPATVVKLVLVGDDREVQQQLLHSFFLECNQEKLAKQVLSNTCENNLELSLNLQVTNEKVKLVLCCVSSQDYPKLRKLNYVDGNAFLICFQDVSDHIESVWFDEVKENLGSLFLVNVKREKAENIVEADIEEVITQEMIAKVNGTFLNINLALKSEDESPAETFLEILEATLEDMDDGTNEESVGTNDVARMQDFESKSIFENVKSRIHRARKQIMSVRIPMEKVKELFKTLKPKNKMKEKRKLKEEEQKKAHYVSRSQTGSLIFLDEDFMDD